MKIIRSHSYKTKREKCVNLVIISLELVMVALLGLAVYISLSKQNQIHQNANGEVSVPQVSVGQVNSQESQPTGDGSSGNSASSETSSQMNSQSQSKPLQGHAVVDQYKGIRPNLDPSKPMIALTFDDGPNAKTTRRIVDALSSVGGRATFFVVGYRLDQYEETLKYAADHGNEIGNHTFNHKSLPKLTIEESNTELDDTANKIRDFTGTYTGLVRPPYGAANDTVKQNVKNPLILWSIDTEDWKTKNANATVNAVMNNAFDGGIVLMHDIYHATADAVDSLVHKLTEKGYQLVTVSELYYYKGVSMEQGNKYFGIYP